MLIRFTPRTVVSTFFIFVLIGASWLYFKNSDYDASSLWEAALTYAEQQPGRTGPDGADELVPRPKGPQDERFPDVANSFGETRPKGERVWRPKPAEYNYTRTLVVPRRKEDVEWVEGVGKELGIMTKIYDLDHTTDNQIPKNKGKEAMVYLTYIIDHYSELPDIVLFFHASRQAWHNNILLDIDSVLTIKRLNLERVDRIGYMNTRCHHDPGCPNWLHLDRPEVDFDKERKPEELYFTKKVWRQLFPGTQPPAALSQPCCSQFAVSRDAVLQHPKSQYVHFRDWLLKTSLSDEYSGRIFEHIWQYIFTGQAELCPNMNSCYCDGYGICFGGGKALEAWMTKVKEVEDLQKQLDRDEMKLATNGRKRAELEATISSLEKEVRAEKLAAYTRGDDPRNRKLERERLD